jgi:hypothetical protein
MLHRARVRRERLRRIALVLPRQHGDRRWIEHHLAQGA